MASWLPTHSGLQMHEIDSLIAMLDESFLIKDSFEEISGMSGFPESGRDLYLGDCAICHAEDGTGDIGPNLNNTDFLASASDRFLFNTLVYGRNTAGMPAWTNYAARDIADLIRFIRTWGNGPLDDLSIRLPAGNPENGDLQFHYLCSRCHGEFGRLGVRCGKVGYAGIATSDTHCLSRGPGASHAGNAASIVPKTG